MSVENKIREFLNNTTVSEAFPGFGQNREEEAPMQGSSEKPQTQELVKGAGSDAAVKAGAATSLAAGSGAMEKSPMPQGSSVVNPPVEDLGMDEPGVVAAARAKLSMGRPMGKGPGQARTTMPSVDPVTVVNQPMSAGNVHREEVETEFVSELEQYIFEDENGEEYVSMTEEEYNALSEDDKDLLEALLDDESDEISEEASDDEFYILSEEEYNALSDEEKEQYDAYELTEEEYAELEKMLAEEAVLTEEEYNALSDEEKAEYELVTEEPSAE